MKALTMSAMIATLFMTPVLAQALDAASICIVDTARPNIIYRLNEDGAGFHTWESVDRITLKSGLPATPETVFQLDKRTDGLSTGTENTAVRVEDVGLFGYASYSEPEVNGKLPEVSNYSFKFGTDQLVIEKRHYVPGATISKWQGAPVLCAEKFDPLLKGSKTLESCIGSVDGSTPAPPIKLFRCDNPVTNERD